MWYTKFRRRYHREDEKSLPQEFDGETQVMMDPSKIGNANFRVYEVRNFGKVETFLWYYGDLV